MTCPQCQFENPAGMKFCGYCGAKLAAVCAQCGSESPAGFKFCGGCGSPLGVPAPAPTLPSASPAPAPEVSRSAGPPQSYTPQHFATQVLQSKSAVPYLPILNMLRIGEADDAPTVAHKGTAGLRRAEWFDRMVKRVLVT